MSEGLGGFLQSANKRRKLKKRDPYIKWSALLRLEDIVPKQGRHKTKYCVLYIDGGGSLISSCEIAERLALYEYYEFEGTVRLMKGGTFLSVVKVSPPKDYNTFKSEETPS